MTDNQSCNPAMCNLILKLGRVERLTLDMNGQPESDTTHSMMLALYAYDIATKANTRAKQESKLQPLNIAKVLLYTLLHDVPEAICGDTPTLVPLTPEASRIKDRNEEEATHHIISSGMVPRSIAPMLSDYRVQSDAESRFVRVLDKAMPALTHAANGCASIKAQGWDKNRLRARLEKLNIDYQDLCPEAPEAWQFLVDAGLQALDAWDK